MAQCVELIIGLGNPGGEYEATRHNAGFWFVDALAKANHGIFKAEKKFHGQVTRLTLHGQDFRLLKPATFMNNSGQAVAALSRFYKITPANILVVHDDLDLPAGIARLKQEGGHGGHNGLRDIISHLGENKFLRLRIGINHPGSGHNVIDYVLKRPSKADRGLIESAMGAAMDIFPQIITGELQKAMHQLHTKM